MVNKRDAGPQLLPPADNMRRMDLFRLKTNPILTNKPVSYKKQGADRAFVAASNSQDDDSPESPQYMEDEVEILEESGEQDEADEYMHYTEKNSTQHENLFANSHN